MFKFLLLISEKKVINKNCSNNKKIVKIIFSKKNLDYVISNRSIIRAHDEIFDSVLR
jgi:hypothetical protein